MLCLWVQFLFLVTKLEVEIFVSVRMVSWLDFDLTLYTIILLTNGDKYNRMILCLYGCIQNLIQSTSFCLLFLSTLLSRNLLYIKLGLLFLIILMVLPFVLLALGVGYARFWFGCFHVIIEPRLWENCTKQFFLFFLKSFNLGCNVS